MNEATFLPAPPLSRTVIAALGDPPARCLVVNAERVAKALRRAGYTVQHWQVTPDGKLPVADAEAYAGPLSAPPPGLEDHAALVLLDVLTGHEDPTAPLRQLVRRARPGALVFVAEPAAWGPGGRFLTRLVGRFLKRPVITDAEVLGTACLGAGLSELRQVWPQGLRSLVLTVGRVHPLAPLLLE